MPEYLLDDTNAPIAVIQKPRHTPPVVAAPGKASGCPKSSNR
jgi:hypothetical protein